MLARNGQILRRELSGDGEEAGEEGTKSKAGRLQLAGGAGDRPGLARGCRAGSNTSHGWGPGKRKWRREDMDASANLQVLQIYWSDVGHARTQRAPLSGHGGTQAWQRKRAPCHISPFRQVLNMSWAIMNTWGMAIDAVNRTSAVQPRPSVPQPPSFP